MSSKNNNKKTQQRKQQRKNQKQAGNASSNAVALQRSDIELQAVKKQFAIQADQIQKIALAVSSVNPQMADSINKIALANKSVIDEKYVKVPTVLEIATEKAKVAQKAYDTAFIQKNEAKTEISKSWAVAGLNQSEKDLAAAAKELIRAAESVVDEKKKPDAFDAFKALMIRRHGPHPLDHSKFLGAYHGTYKPSVNQPYKMRVVQKYSSTAVNAVGTTVMPLYPNNSDDAKILATVFDICRTQKIHVLVNWHIIATGTGLSGNPTLPVDFGLAYDPANSGTYSSVAQTLEATYNIGVSACSLYGTRADGQHMRHLEIKVPRLVDPGIVTDLLDGNWTVGSDTNVLVGWLKPYIENPGAGSTLVLECFVTFEMEWAFRT